ncbi:MAG TPA: 23S rRNA (guanosine(2251)-2'-O)-methyltransferase RlmB [Thermoflexia bacterium]|jgi:23S rRNA (guanosine2251-2'-O)-methyltransferase|nr:23S rRNA (guanosine(2251)-2'-O)-methyltransferase RlmB [Thermoflexia bacterium]
MRETLYGRNAVYESLRAGRRQFYRLLLAETVRAVDVVADILALAEAANVPVERVPRRHLDWLGEANHQGVVLEASEYPYSDLDAILAEAQRRGEPPFLLLLDLLQDPQNLGSLLRTAEAVGVHGAVIQRRRAAGITPAVVHTSAGAVEHLRVAQVTNLPDAIVRLKGRDVWVVGLENVRGAQRYDQVDLSGSLALVVGSEGKGLRRLVQDRCDLVIYLPMVGQVTSLNAAVAGSVVLYEAWRQRVTR